MARTLRTMPPPIKRTISTWCGPWLRTTPRLIANSCFMRGRYMNSLKFQVLIMQSLPSSPPLTISRIFRIGGSKLCVWPQSNFTPFFSAAWFMASHSASVIAMGFSTMICFPDCAAVIVCSAWSGLGVAIYTASTSGLRHSSATLV